MKTFTNKTAIVTGAASGIGFALSRELCRQSAKVVMSDVQEEVIEKAGSTLSSQDFDVRSLPLDVRDNSAFKELITRTIAEKGRLDYIFDGRSFQQLHNT